jgi:hypothetical protein
MDYAEINKAGLDLATHWAGSGSLFYGPPSAD